MAAKPPWRAQYHPGFDFAYGKSKYLPKANI
jgi:hypothetical protein